jgi:hypothetical protein
MAILQGVRDLLEEAVVAGRVGGFGGENALDEGFDGGAVGGGCAAVCCRT